MSNLYENIDKALVKIAILSKKFYETKRVALLLYPDREIIETDSQNVVYLKSLNILYCKKDSEQSLCNLLYITYPIYEYESEPYNLGELLELAGQRIFQLKALVKKYTDFSEQEEVLFNNEFQEINCISELADKFHVFVCKRIDILNHLAMCKK